MRGDEPWPDNTFVAKGKHSSDAITDLSLDWLENGRDKEKPFMLLHHFKAPHLKFEYAPRYEDFLADVEIPEPENLYDQPAEGFGSPGSRPFGPGLSKARATNDIGKKLKIDQTIPEPQYTKAAYQIMLKKYLRTVKGVDDNVQRLVDYLSETDELDNTLIIYTSDQGFFLGEHDLVGKRWMYDEAMRMPFIVHWPDGVEAGTTNDWLINNTDFAPTILELAGVGTPGYMQGRSFAGALRGEGQPKDWRTATYYRYWMHEAHIGKVAAHFGIRTTEYKLFFIYGSERGGKQRTPVGWELYDLTKDPNEMQNIYADPAYAEVVEDLKQQLLDLREKLNETDANYPEIQKIVESHWDR